MQCAHGLQTLPGERSKKKQHQVPGPLEERIAIIGAGIGGLTAALAMQQLGLHPVIFEQAQLLGEIGAGLTLAPNATRILMALGLGPRLAAQAVVPEAQIVQHYQSAATLVVTPRGQATTDRYGAPYWQVHRADLHAALADAVLANDPDCLCLGHQLTALRAADHGAELGFAHGAAVQVALAIGADGVKSLTRRTLDLQDSPAYTGYVAWRGVVPVERVPPEALAPVQPAAGVYIGPGRMFAHYLLRQGRLVNFVAYARQPEWTVESWTARSEVAEVMGLFADFHPAVQAVIEATPPEQCFKWALLSREPLAAWSDGPVSLLGDAAHPTLPFLGQGANMAIEDGMVLARALAGGPDSISALQLYERARRARCALVMRRSVDAVVQYLSPHPEDFDDARLVNEEKLGLFSYDAATVPV